MHYPEYAFAKLRYYFLIINIKLLYFPSLQNETEPTIEPLKSMKELECKNIGQHEGLSKLDLQKINLLYNCKKKCSNERSFWLNSWVQCSAEHRLIYELIEFWILKKLLIKKMGENKHIFFLKNFNFIIFESSSELFVKRCWRCKF